MSVFFDACKSLLVLPRDYNAVRPHHVVLLYAASRIVTASTLLDKISKYGTKLLNHLSVGLIPLVYAGLVPDVLIRWGIRIQCYHHLNTLRQDSAELELEQKLEIISELKCMPIAVETKAANDQHYEVPARFYDLCLGPCKKYSSGLWPHKNTTFNESEILMLDLYCQRADIEDGMHVVDLGCGWGSLTLHLAMRFPNCKITSISNSHSQRDYIMSTAKARGYKVENITVITCNVADDQGALSVVTDNDRVMTVEMFEHMKNYKDLLEKIHAFLKPTGKLFVHIFTHKDFVYHFDKGWMSDNFFTGGTMPSDDLLLYFAQDFSVEQHWRVNGTNYEKTSNGWLAMLDDSWRAGTLKPVLVEAYGVGEEYKWYVNWRLFYLACAELFGLDNGEEWIVSHYLFQRR